MPRTTKPAPTAHGVVVGVDGTPASVNALRYARSEAARLGEPVDVVHVVPDYAPLAGRHPTPPDDLMVAGRSVLQGALDRLGPTSDDAAVATHVQRGSVAPTLTAAGSRARTVVVGSDRRPVAMRLLTGNVSTGVAARCPAPVVAVPETWRADHPAGVVLVGVKHHDRSEALLAEAFDLARERGSRLVALHAWQFPYVDDDRLVTDRAAFQDWRARAQRELEDLVAPWRQRCPEVDVEVRSVHGQAAQALVAASAEADELVIARRAHGVPAAAHLGSTARAVLLHAHCPVRVVPVPHGPGTTDLELEAAGAPLKQTTT